MDGGSNNGNTHSSIDISTDLEIGFLPFFTKKGGTVDSSCWLLATIQENCEVFKCGGGQFNLLSESLLDARSKEVQRTRRAHNIAL
jgi:hypothetical protein